MFSRRIGTYNDSFPLSIDAARGVYDISIPQVNVDSTYTLVDEGYKVEQI